MKQKKYIALVITTILIIVGSFIIIKYKFRVEQKINNAENEITYNVYEKSTSQEADDGWFYLFYMQRIDNVKAGIAETEKISHFFTGINLKYETIPGYEIDEHVINQKGEELYVRHIPTFPTFNVSPVIKNGVLLRDEVEMIDNYFDKKQFNRVITMEDIEDLALVNFDKKKILELYNKMIQKEYKTELTKFEVYLGEYRKDKIENGYKWHTSMIALRTSAVDIYIDIIYENGEYLSNLIKSNKASKEQKEIYKNIEKISEYIINNQSVDFEDSFSELKKDKNFQRLFKILETYDDGYDTYIQE